MTENVVLSSTELLLKNPKFVKINDNRLKEVAEKFSKDYDQGKLKIPQWNFDEHLEGNFNEVVDMFFLANTINFAFTDFETEEKYTTNHFGNTHKGSAGMWAALKNAHLEGFPILDGNYLENISKTDMKDIFEGNIEIPMFKERLDIFRETGYVLNNRYEGHFHNLLEDSDGRLFNSGKGVVDRLTSEFPSFDDSTIKGGIKFTFNKRAQLAGGMLYGRFQDNEISGNKIFTDEDKLTVFADYVLPKGLRDLRVINYEDSLAEKVDNGKLIQKNSLEELEIRAATIHACNGLIKTMNEKYRQNVNALHIDAKLWGEARKDKETKHHLTETINY